MRHIAINLLKKGIFTCRKTQRPLTKRPSNTCIFSKSIIFTYFLTLGSPLIAGPLNPTGRTLSISMPIFVNGSNQGELMMQLDKDDNIALDSLRFIQIATPYINDEHLDDLNLQAEATPLFSKSFLEEYGYKIEYDPALLQLNLSWPAHLKSIRYLDRIQKSGQNKSQALRPSTKSAYLNMFAGASWSDRTAQEQTKHSLALEGAISIPELHHVTFESEARLSNNANLKRQGTRVVLDQLNQSRRWQAGDVTSEAYGYLGAQKMLGVTLSRNLGQFRQDQRLSRPTGRTSFFLERSSIVRILVNGRLKSERRLDAGPYQLDQFPISYGSNRVVIEIEDDTGLQDRLVFNLFSDSQFLAPQQSEMSFSAGIGRELLDDESKYSSDSLLSGFYRRGITSGMTVSGYGQITEHLNLLGMESLFAVPGGRLSVDTGISRGRGSDTIEKAANAGWSFLFPNSAKNRNKRLYVGAGYSSEFFSRSTSSDFTANQTNARLDYSQSISPLWSFGFSHQQNNNYDNNTSTASGFRVNFNRRHFNLRMEFDKQRDFHAKDEHLFVIRMSYRFESQQSISASISDDQNFNASYHLNGRRQGVGAWQLGFNTSSNNKDNQDAGVSTHYEGNRAEFNASHRINLPENGDTSTNHTNINIATAIAYTDGKVAIGRPIRDSFVIFSPHKNLENKKTYIDKDQHGNYSASSSMFGPALYPLASSYNDSSLGYDVEDLPLGYNLGKGVAQVFPTYKSGFHEVIGSNATVTVIGNLVNEKGEPAKLLTGIAEPINAQTQSTQAVFTNSVGRFSAQGLSPGEWKITLHRKKSKLVFLLNVPDSTVGLLRAGELQPVTVE